MRKVKKFLALVLALLMLVSVLTACGGNNDTPAPEVGGENVEQGGSSNEAEGYTITEFDPNKTYTARYYTSALAASWDPLTYQAQEAADILDNLRSDLYTFAFNDELHPVEGKDPFEGYIIIPSMASGMPIDVTEEVKAAHPDWIPESATEGYAWKVPLRDDIYFDNGHHITAQTIVDSAKLLLDPERLNFRATDFYKGAYGVVGAEAYALGMGGQLITEDNGLSGVPVSEMTKDEQGQYVSPDGYPVYIAIDVPLDWCQGDTLRNTVDTYGEQYFGLDTWDALTALADEDGLVPCTDDNLALLAGLTTTNPAWGETEDDLYNYLVFVEGRYPDELKFEDTVGIYADSDYEITFVYKSAASGFTLFYNALGVSFIVDPEVYESCLTSTETANGTVWTSTYMTSAETSPSYGPYSLVDYQTDKSAHLRRNDSWYGFNDTDASSSSFVYLDPNDGNVYRWYQTTDIEFEVVTEYATQRQMFLSGDFLSYGLKPEDFNQYRNSEFCYADPGATVFFFVVNGNLDAIRAREANGDFDETKLDLESMTLKSFRKALGLTFDKDAFCAAISPARTPGLGIWGDTYIYDPETCAFYRDTPQAKQVLCDFYGVDVSQFASLDDAVDSITGYDPEQAKELYQQAFEEALELGYITDSNNDGVSDQTLTLYYATDTESEMVTRIRDYFNTNITEVLKGTGWYDEATKSNKIAFDISPVLSDWVEPLRNGEYDYALAGWAGALMDPFHQTNLYVDPNYQYDAGWFDATTVDLTINIDGEDITMNLKQWSDALNGTTVTANNTDYNFGSATADVETRLDILAAFEGAILSNYNYMPFMTDGTMSLLSQKCYYVTEEYNPVLSRGGIEYMKYNYDDAAWNDFCKEQIAEHGQLQY